MENAKRKTFPSKLLDTDTDADADAVVDADANVDVDVLKWIDWKRFNVP